MHNFSSSGTFLKPCPIVLSITTFSYDLARIFCGLLSPVVPDHYSCKDTFSFDFQIKKASFSDNFLFFFDATSLFTRTSLQETIHIEINLILNHNPNLNITKQELKKHFLFATSQTHFFFNGKFHN